MSSIARIGIVGFGYIGAWVYEQITTHPEWGLEVAFVSGGSKAAGRVPEELLLGNLAEAARMAPDLVVEMAHPAVTVEHGEGFLRHADYMPLSLTALADSSLEQRLRETAASAGTCLYIPHGAAVGLDSLSECRDIWEEVRIIMKKNPRNLDFSDAPQFPPDAIVSETVLYDGPTRDLCALFPRNVNSHAAVALAGIGFDRTRSVLIADPAIEASVIELQARGDGVALKVERSNPLKGVSGVLTLRAILGSIQRAKAPGLHFQIC